MALREGPLAGRGRRRSLSGFPQGRRSKGRAKRPPWPSASSMRSTSFHFAIRSERANEPTLSWPAFQPTARWAIATSSVSPDRAETIVPKPAALPASSAALASVTRAGLVRLDQHRVAGPGRAASRTRSAFVTRKSSPMTWSLSPNAAVKRQNPSGSSSAKRVLDRDDRVAFDPAPEHPDHAVGVELALLQCETVAPAASELGGGDVERDRDLVAGREAGALDRPHEHIERLLVATRRSATSRPRRRRPGRARARRGLPRGAIDLGGAVERLGEGRRIRRRRP